MSMSVIASFSLPICIPLLPSVSFCHCAFRPLRLSNFICCCCRLACGVASAPGQRLPPCPHFLEGCSGCKLLHLDPSRQWTAKHQLVQQMLQQLQREQQQQEQQQHQGTPYRPPSDIKLLVPAPSEAQ